MDEARLANSASDPAQWLTGGRDEGGTYFSPLTQINAENVTKLGFAWDYKVGTTRGLEATPIVVDGVMYTSGVGGRVYALDAETGKEVWTYIRKLMGSTGATPAAIPSIAALPCGKALFTWAVSMVICTPSMQLQASASGKSTR